MHRNKELRILEQKKNQPTIKHQLTLPFSTISDLSSAYHRGFLLVITQVRPDLKVDIKGVLVQDRHTVLTKGQTGFNRSI